MHADTNPLIPFMYIPSRDCRLDCNFEWKISNSRLTLNMCGRENKRILLYVLSKLFIFGLSDLQSRWLNDFWASHRKLSPLYLQVCTYRYSLSCSTFVLIVTCFHRSIGCTQVIFASWLQKISLGLLHNKPTSEIVYPTENQNISV